MSGRMRRPLRKTGKRRFDDCPPPREGEELPRGPGWYSYTVPMGDEREGRLRSASSRVDVGRSWPERLGDFLDENALWVVVVVAVLSVFAITVIVFARW